MPEILLIDDEPELKQVLEELLTEAGFKVTSAADGAEGLDHLARTSFDVVVCDVRLPKVDGLTLLRRVRRDHPTTEVILMTAFADVAAAVLALKEGAYDYLTKPFDADELLMQLRRIGEFRTLRRELDRARDQLIEHQTVSTLIGDSPAMRRVNDLINMVSQSDAPTLIVGESGTGKELVARMIHERSPRKGKPFVAVNCGALVENLIEAELFGHERGAFTGAIKKRDGRFKAAHGGTLFLDEVAELPLAAQAKLLRVLQEGTFEPLGTNTPIQVDVRILSATHRDLRERIKAGAFREDLFYRIDVIEIPVPPLRERRGDLAQLFRLFLQRMTPPGTPTPQIAPGVWAILTQYPFPGNVREFAHAVEHALLLSGGKEIDVHHLPPGILRESAPLAEAVVPDAAPLAAIRPLSIAVREFELEYLHRAVATTGGKRLKAAELLGISRKTLWEKLRNGDPDASLSDAESASEAPTVV